MLLGTYSVKQCCPSNNCLHFTIRYTSNFHATVHIMYIHCNAWLMLMPVPVLVPVLVPVPVQSHISHTWCDCMSCCIFPTNFPLARYIVSGSFFLSFYVHFVLRIIVVVAILFFILISHLLFQHILSFYVCVWGFTHFCNWFNFIKSILKCNHMKNSAKKIPTTATNKWQGKKTRQNYRNNKIKTKRCIPK